MRLWRRSWGARPRSRRSPPGWSSLGLVRKVVTSTGSLLSLCRTTRSTGDDPGTTRRCSLSLPREILMDAMDTLLPREKKLLALRLGLVDGLIHTQGEISTRPSRHRTSLYLSEGKLVRRSRHLYSKNSPDAP